MSAKRLESVVLKITEEQLTKPEVILRNLEYSIEDAQTKRQKIQAKLNKIDKQIAKTKDDKKKLLELYAQGKTETNLNLVIIRRLKQSLLNLKFSR